MGDIKTYDEYRGATLEAVECYNRQEYQTALQKFTEMAEANFKNYKVHEMLVYTHLKLNNTNEAEKEYDIYLDLLKKEMPGLKKPASFDDLVKGAGKVEERKKSFEKMLKKPNPANLIEDSEVPMKLSLLYMAQGDYEAAEEVITQFQKAYLGA